MIIVVTPDDRGREGLSALVDLLSGDDRFDGALQLRADPGADHLGGFADALAVAAGSGGAVSTLLWLIGVWLRDRGSDVDVTLSADGTSRSVHLSGRRLRGLDAASLPAIAAEVAAALAAFDGDGAPPPAGR